MMGSSSSSLRRSLLIGAAAACAFAVALGPGTAVAAGLAPDPAPEGALQPDAYPQTPAPSPPVSRPRAPAPFVPPTPVRRTAPPVRRAAPHHRPRTHVTNAPSRPPVRLPFPTDAITWFSGAAAPAVSARRDVPTSVALALAALVLASAVFLAGAAREAVR
jgi:hypothetical protein